jgi:hypothetical protein
VDSEETGQESDQEREYAPGTDPILVNMLNRMEALNYAQDVTLTVQGFLISGTPVFLAEYLEKLGVVMERSWRNGAQQQRDPAVAEALVSVGESMRETLTKEAAQYKLPEASQGDDEAEARRDAVIDEIMAAPREMIMLKRVTVILPSGEQIDAPLWRGRLAHVAGWWFGRSLKYIYSGEELDEEVSD